jgi:hypothetical protein
MSDGNAVFLGTLGGTALGLLLVDASSAAG